MHSYTRIGISLLFMSLVITTSGIARAATTGFVPTGPLYVTFDNTFADVNGRTGERVNNSDKIIFGKGVVGSAAQFTASDSYIEYLCSQTFSKDAGTVQVLAKFDNFTNSDAVIFHTNNSNYILYYDYASDDTQKRITARAGGEANPALYSFDQSTGTQNKLSKGWHLYDMTWSGAPKGSVSLYIDGVLADTQNYTGGTDCSTFRIGANYWPGMNWGDGWIDELKVYNVVRTPEEIREAYKSYNLTSEPVAQSPSVEIYGIETKAVSETAMSIKWFTSRAADTTGWYRVLGTSNWVGPKNGDLNTRTHTVVFDNLTPGTTYEYFVTSGAGTVVGSTTLQTFVQPQSRVTPNDPQQTIKELNQKILDQQKEIERLQGIINTIQSFVEQFMKYWATNGIK